MIRKRIQGILGYGVFALVVAGVCVWYGFPYTAYVNARLAEMRSSFVSASVRDAKPLLPLGMSLQSLKISCPAMPQSPVVTVDGVGLRISLPALVFGKLNTTVDADLSGGSLQAWGTLSPRNAPRDLDGTVIVKDIGLAGLSPCLGRMGDVSGTVSGKVFFAGRMDRLAQGEGNATLSVEDVTAVLNYPLVAGFAVNEGLGTARVRMLKGRLEILSCTFESRGIKGTLKGKIVFRTPVEKSRLQLAVTLVGDEDINEQPAAIALIMQPGVTHKINLSGTFEQPKMRLVS